ncbi:hypothetical protein ACOMHN_042218 [Nucella lapillus]
MSIHANESEWTFEKVESFLSELSETSFRNRAQVVLYLSLISIVGFVGNTVVLLVYGLRFKPSATRVFVLCMACLDMVTNALGLPLQIATIRYAYNDNYWRCRGFFTFATLSTQASGFLLVLVAVDRFWRICMPLRRQLNSRQAFTVSLATVGSALVIFAPFVPYYGMHRINTSVPGVQARMCWSEDEYKHTPYPLVYKVFVGVALALGLTILSASYVSIGTKLWMKRTQKKCSPRVDEQNVSTTSTSGSGTDEHGRKSRTAQLQNETEGNASETSFSESVSTECHFSNTDTQHPETSVTKVSEVPDTQTGGRKERMETPSDALRPDQCRPRSEDFSKVGKSSNLENEQKRTTILEEKKATAKGPSVNKCIRRMRSRTTLMMSVLTFFYLSNWLPHFAMRSVRSDPVNWCDNFTECGYNTYAIVIRSYYLNSAINAFVYSFCNGLFRQKCRDLFCDFGKKIRTRMFGERE